MISIQYFVGLLTVMSPTKTKQAAEGLKTLTFSALNGSSSHLCRFEPIRLGSFVRLIESMMVLRPRQGNLRQVFRLFSLMRGFAEYKTNNLKTSLRFPCRGINTIIEYFSHASSFFFISKKTV